MSKKHIPFLNLRHLNDPIRNLLIEDFNSILDSAWFIMGNHLASFEKAYANYSGVQHAIGVANGLDAIHLSLLALDIKEGDEVIVPSNTYIATWLAVTYTGAKIVPVEPDLNTYNITASAVEKALTENTKALIPVHLYGQPCIMDEIMQLADSKGFSVVEDNAQAHGALFCDQRTGSFGHINATSFYPGKNLGALGDGGGVTTNSDNLAKKVLALRNYGSVKKYYNEVIGFNSRLDEVQAAFLIRKLHYLDTWNKERRRLANYYIEHLIGVGDIILPFNDPRVTPVYHLFVIRTKFRDKLKLFLEQNGIETLIHYPVPPHLQKAYNFLGFKRGDFPVAEELAATTISLPLWVGLSEDDQISVVNTIKLFFNQKL